MQAAVCQTAFRAALEELTNGLWHVPIADGTGRAQFVSHPPSSRIRSAPKSMVTTLFRPWHNQFTEKTLGMYWHVAFTEKVWVWVCVRERESECVF